jgi:hypothetical protein
MSEWTSDELTKIDSVDEVEITSLRKDGTLRPYRIIWGVRLGDDFYVRSVNGRDAAWFRGTRVRHEGRIQAGGVDKDVSFVDVDGDALNDEIDAAYRRKYRRYSSPVDAITSAGARSATLKLVPRA